MEIDVTAQNIDDYGLDQLTGNTKEELLRMASEAHRSGMDLKFKIPDAASSERRINVFDAVKGQVVPPEDLEHASNPIEEWDGQEIPLEAQVDMHQCDLPTIVTPGDNFTCPACRKRYYADDIHLEWVQEGELE